MNAIVTVRRNAGIVELSRTIGAVLSAVRIYEDIRKDGTWALAHHPRSVPTALRLRSEKLCNIVDVNNAEIEFFRALSLRNVDWQICAAILATLYHAMAVKPETADGLVQGALDLLVNDELGAIAGWKPIRATPTILAIAARKILHSAIYPPKPSEIVAACREVRGNLKTAQAICENWLDDVQKADAILLQFDRDEWRRAYLQNRSALEVMLTKHGFADLGAEFEKLVEQEQIKTFV